MVDKRIINLQGGSYHANIEGDYVQGSKSKPKEEKQQKSAAPRDEGEEIINTNGANYVESLAGVVIHGDLYEEERR